MSLKSALNKECNGKFPPFFLISYKHTDENHLTCNEPPLEITEEDTNNFIMVYTYSVKFEASIPCSHLAFYRLDT